MWLLCITKHNDNMLVWCYSECIYTPSRLEKYAWPRWDSNLRPLSTFQKGRWPDILQKDILRKDILPNGHFADGRFAERTFCRTDILPNGHFAERTVCRADSLPKIEISCELYRFAYTVKISGIRIILDFDNRNFDSEVLFHFIFFLKFLTLSLPKFRDIKNNIIHHYWWILFPWKLWMYSMILEVKFAYDACLFTSWRQNTFSIFGKFSFRQNVRSAKCPFGKTSVRQNVRSAERPFGKMSVLQNVFRQSFFRQNVFRQNVRVPKCRRFESHRGQAYFSSLFSVYTHSE